MMKKTSEVCEMFNLDRNYLRRLDNKGKGLLPPTDHDKSGLHTGLYDDEALERLWMIILLHRELGYELDDVAKILDDPNFDRNECLGTQIEALRRKADHINNVIKVAEAMKFSGMKPQDIIATNNMTASEYVDVFAGQMDAVSPETSENVDKAIKDEVFLNAFSRIAAAKKKEIDISDATVRSEVSKMLAVFEKHFGKSGKYALKRIAEMLLGGGDFSSLFDKPMGAGVSAYVGKAITNYLERS